MKLNGWNQENYKHTLWSCKFKNPWPQMFTICVKQILLLSQSIDKHTLIHLYDSLIRGPDHADFNTIGCSHKFQNKTERDTYNSLNNSLYIGQFRIGSSVSRPERPLTVVTDGPSEELVFVMSSTVALLLAWLRRIMNDLGWMSNDWQKFHLKALCYTFCQISVAST